DRLPGFLQFELLGTIDFVEQMHDGAISQAIDEDLLSIASLRLKIVRQIHGRADHRKITEAAVPADRPEHHRVGYDPDPYIEEAQFEIAVLEPISSQLREVLHDAESASHGGFLVGLMAKDRQHSAPREFIDDPVIQQNQLAKHI